MIVTRSERQFFVCAGLHDLSVFQHDDLVCIAECAQAVRHDHAGHAIKPINGLTDGVLVGIV